jgi:hypothetical protein
MATMSGGPPYGEDPPAADAMLEILEAADTAGTAGVTSAVLTARVRTSPRRAAYPVMNCSQHARSHPEFFTCFRAPQATNRIENRAHSIIYTAEASTIHSS